MAGAENSEPEFVLYRNRPEWGDVIPLSQDNGASVVAIAYSEKCNDLEQIRLEPACTCFGIVFGS